METMQFHINKTDLVLTTFFFAQKWSQGTKWHVKEIGQGVQSKFYYPLGTSISDGPIFKCFIKVY